MLRTSTGGQATPKNGLVQVVLQYERTSTVVNQADSQGSHTRVSVSRIIAHAPQLEYIRTSKARSFIHEDTQKKMEAVDKEG